MRLGYTILYVPDVEQAVSFYERAFGLTRRFVHEGGDYAEMETGATALAFVAHGLARSNFDVEYRPSTAAEAPAGFEIVLVTDDVELAFETATRAGAAPLSAPAEKPWGQQVAYVRDLNGVTVELASPVA